MAQLYERPVRSLIADPAKTCPGCVFTRQNEVLGAVRGGRVELGLIQPEAVEHANFV